MHKSTGLKVDASNAMRIASGRVWTLALVAGLCVSLPAFAQVNRAQPAAKPATPDPAPAAVATPSSPSLAPSPLRPALQSPAWTMEDYAARSLQRLAMVDLRSTGMPDQRDYKLASVLMDLAGKLNPNDADLVRRRIECEWNAGDEESAINSSQQLLKLDPADTVAQLRLISARIARFQTAEERLAAYERFIGAEGKGLDPSIRSRLALDAALLYRERNNEDKFVEKLKQATALDSTNKEAALIATTYFTESINDPVGRLELQSNLLYSDPLDPQVYLNMVDELASGGAFNGASRMFGIAEKILTAAGVALSQDQEMHRLVLAWQVGGPKAVRELLEKSLNTDRHMARQVADHQKVMNVPGEEVIDPLAIRLPRIAEYVRILTSFAEGNKEALDTSLTDLDLTVTKMLTESADDSKRPAQISRADAMRVAADSFLDLNLFRALTGAQLDKLVTDFSKLDPVPDASDTRPAIIAAIVKGNSGDHSTAIAELLPLSIDPASATGEVTDSQLFAQLAKGLFYEKQGQKAEAGAAYREIIKRAPLTMQGALATSLLERLSGKREPVFAKTEALEKLASSIPRWIEDIVNQPRTFVGVSVEPLSTTQDPLSPMLVKMSIRNLGAVPMGLGSNRPINSRFLFTPSIDLKSLDARSLARPEVIDLDRRLRLMPGEKLEAVVWADPGITGWFCETIAGSVIRAKYRAVQGFVTGTKGGIDPGPGCIQTDLPIVVRTTLRESTLGSADLAAEVASANESAVVRLAAAARALVLGEEFNGRKMSTVDRSTMAEAFAKRYAGLSPVARSALVSTLPHAHQAPEFAVFDEVAKQETDPSVLPVVLLTRSSSAEDPFLKSAMESSDPKIKLIAQLQAERLGQNVVCYATFGPDMLHVPKSAESASAGAEKGSK